MYTERENTQPQGRKTEDFRMNEKTARQIAEMKNQTIGVEVEMNSITRQKAAKVAAAYFGTGRYENTAGRNGYSTWSAWDAQGREWKFQKDVSIAGPDEQKCELVTPILTYGDIETLQELCRQEITDLGKEIARLERQEALEAELNRPVNKPLTGKPMSGKEETKTGRATDEYRQNFWNMMRSKAPMPSVVNALQIGTDSEGGYLVPDEYERTLVEALEEENVFRQLARVIQTSSGDRKIPVVATKGTASWIDEEGAYTESDDSFGQVSIGAYKLGTMIKVSEELLNDSVFDLESYISREFARRIGAKEEEAFFTGDGSGKPLGILAASGGAETGITAASATAITADELIDLFYSLKSPYRRNAVWVLNDSTIKAVRKLKDGSGQYLWQPSLTAGTPDTILGRPVRTSAYMPAIAASAKTIAFGDFSYYWIADRQGRSFKRLNELYAANGQVGFLASQRVDGKIILPEAVKVLVQKAS
nr:MAG: capsid family protein [Bacteriophage sp.]